LGKRAFRVVEQPILKEVRKKGRALTGNTVFNERRPGGIVERSRDTRSNVWEGDARRYTYRRKNDEKIRQKCPKEGREKKNACNSETKFIGKGRKGKLQTCAQSKGSWKGIKKKDQGRQKPDRHSEKEL